MLLRDAIIEFLAWKKFTIRGHAMSGYINDLRQLCLYLHNPDIEKINWGDISKLTEEMTEYGWDPNSFVRKFISYRKFFEYWHKKNPKVLDHEWIPVQHMEYRQPRVINDEQYKKLLSVCQNELPTDYRNLALINMLWDTGARVGELMSLNIEDLNFDHQTALIRTEKSRGKRPMRQIFWTEETNENLIKWLRVREKMSEQKGFFDRNALFLALSGKAYGQRFSIAGVSQILGILCRRAKIQRMNAHSFRHHMGHDIIKKGGTNSDVSNILGHSDLSSSYIYTQMSGQELQERYKHFKGTGS